VTYQDFYQQCNTFIDKLDDPEISSEHRERMRDSVLSVMAFAQERERRGESFA
jgi:hypothetical protein